MPWLIDSVVEQHRITLVGVAFVIASMAAFLTAPRTLRLREGGFTVTRGFGHEDVPWGSVTSVRLGRGDGQQRYGVHLGFGEGKTLSVLAGNVGKAKCRQIAQLAFARTGLTPSEDPENGATVAYRPGYAPKSKAAPEPDPPPAPQPAPAPADRGAAWGKPFTTIDRVWTKIEIWLCTGVLIAEVLVLVGWISVHGLSTPYVPGAPWGGIFFRSLFGAIVLGLVAHVLLRPRDAKDAARKTLHTYVVTGAVFAGLVLGPFWANVGVAYAQNLRNWLDTSSVLLLLGGLGGLLKQLTLWLALLGASLATQNGKHIHFDLGIRKLSPASRKPVVVVGGVVAALVCFFAAAGFVDNIASTRFNVPADTPVGEKIDRVTTKIGTDIFLLGRQIPLDFKMLPRVVGGKSYKDSLTGAEWNEWIRGADWAAHFPKDAVEGQIVDPGTPQVPAIPYPGGPEVPGELLLRETLLVFPFGFVMIGLRLLLRVLLILANRIAIDPDAAHAEDPQVTHGGDAPSGKAAA